MSVADNIAYIQKKIAAAAQDRPSPQGGYGPAGAKRDPSGVTLVAVSKKQPDSRIEEALRAGQRVFGENRVQEAMERWGGLKGLSQSSPLTNLSPLTLTLSPEGRGDYRAVRLHLIGPLQTNKVKEAVALFDVIESLDREKLADALAKEMDRQGRRVPCLIQVNTGAEPQKSGVLPGEAADLLDYCRGECGLDVRGLMCIPPVDEPPALHFALLAKLGRELGLNWLSMGMSGDFEDAVRLGATHVRVGSALFGARENK